MKIIIVDNGSKHIKAIEKICQKHGRTEVLSFDNLEQVVDDKNTMLVLSGGHSYPVKYNHELYAKEMALIKNSKMPIIGICLGFELIAECYGASLKLRKRRLHRLVRIHKTHQDPAIAGLESVLTYQAHRWMLESVEPPLQELARSKSEVEIFRHITKPIYAMQFHPEVSIGRNNGRKILDGIIAHLAA